MIHDQAHSKKQETGWRRWMARLAALEKAMDWDPLEIHERRIRRLEEEVATLRRQTASAEQFPRVSTE